MDNDFFSHDNPANKNRNPRIPHLSRVKYPVTVLPTNDGAALKNLRVPIAGDEVLTADSPGTLSRVEPEGARHDQTYNLDWTVGLAKILPGWPHDAYNVLRPDQPGPGLRTAAIPAIFNKKSRLINLPDLFVPLTDADGNGPRPENVLRWKLKQRQQTFHHCVTVVIEYQVFALISPLFPCEVVDYVIDGANATAGPALQSNNG